MLKQDQNDSRCYLPKKMSHPLFLFRHLTHYWLYQQKGYYLSPRPLTFSQYKKVVFPKKPCCDPNINPQTLQLPLLLILVLVTNNDVLKTQCDRGKSAFADNVALCYSHWSVEIKLVNKLFLIFLLLYFDHFKIYLRFYEINYSLS